MEAAPLFNSSLEPLELTQFFRSVRRTSRALVAPLSDADATVQSMPDASPAKWHLAHTTWFFECMVLLPYSSEYRVFDERFNFLFNSYYESIGARHARPKRGLLTRPTLDAVYGYRDHVDAAVEQLLQGPHSASVTQLVELGCHHEQQHQELLLTDILHLFAQNPLKPAYKSPEPLPFEAQPLRPAAYLGFEGGTLEVGHEGAGFAFDCEGPRHRVFVEPYRLADRLVSNREWIEFMAGGGYQNPLLWLAEGWTEMRLQGWTMPLYWERRDDTYWTMTLRGSQPVDPDAPVTHVSFFEADAYATWAHAAQGESLDGNFADSGRLRPKRMSSSGGGIHQLFGDVWEWTRSAFQPYPRFRAAAGAVGEYNGKFMSGQLVLRGGSCVTPAGHVRASYRNFFPPATRWQFSGVRLAEDADTSPNRSKRLGDSFRSDVLSGLRQSNKTLPSRWLYDAQGSELFEEITRLPDADRGGNSQFLLRRNRRVLR